MSKDKNVAVSMHDVIVDNSENDRVVSGNLPSENIAPEPGGQEGGESQDTLAQDQDQKQDQQGQDQKQDEGTPDYIADIQSQLAAINSQMSQAAKGDPEAGDVGNPAVELDQAMAELREQASNGDITYAEMIEKTAPLLEQRIAMQVQQQMSQEQQAQQARSAQEAFLAENPDFMEFAQSPEAEAIMASNPVLDRVSAYYAWKNQETIQMVQATQAQLEELKQKMNNSIEGARNKQGTLAGTGGGDDLSVPNLHRGDGLTPHEGGLAALRKARAEV